MVVETYHLIKMESQVVFQAKMQAQNVSIELLPRTSTLTVDSKYFDKTNFGFEDAKREPRMAEDMPEEGDNGADVGKMEQDGDDNLDFDNEQLPDDSSLFGVLYHRYRHVRPILYWIFCMCLIGF